MIIIAEAEERVIEGSIAYLRGRKRTERGTFDIVLFWLLFIVMRLGKEEKNILYVPGNIIVEMYTSSSGGSHHHWGRGGTKPSICAEGRSSHHFIHVEEEATTHLTILSPTNINN